MLCTYTVITEQSKIKSLKLENCNTPPTVAHEAGMYLMT